MKTRGWMLFLISILFSSGCATTRTVSFLINSEPTGAKIFDEGKYLGKTPSTLQYETLCDEFASKCNDIKTQQITVVHDGYKPETNSFKFDGLSIFRGKNEFSTLFLLESLAPRHTSEQQQQQQQMMGPTVIVGGERTGVSSTGLVSINSRPQTEVFIDGALVGISPIQNLRLPEGEHSLELRQKGYQTWARKIRVFQSSTITLEPTLEMEMQVATEKEFGGVGISVGIKNGQITVMAPPFEGGPAYRAGIKEADKILKIDGEPTKDMSLEEFVTKARGPRGSSVTVTIMRDGFSNPRDFVITRDIIRF
jgi:hypothetical protein